MGVTILRSPFSVYSVYSVVVDRVYCHSKRGGELQPQYTRNTRKKKGDDLLLNQELHGGPVRLPNEPPRFGSLFHSTISDGVRSPAGPEHWEDSSGYALAGAS